MGGWVSGSRRRIPLRPISAVALLLLLVVTGVATWATHSLVRDQERRLLKERGAEVNIVLTTAIAAIPQSLSGLGGTVTASSDPRPEFERAAQQQVAAGPGTNSFAWLRPKDGGFVVQAAAGTTLQVGQVITDARATAMTRALSSGEKMAAAPVVRMGEQRLLGFALGPPAAPAGTVVYRETVLGPVAPPRSANGNPAFSDIDAVLYATPKPDPTQVLTSTTKHYPLTGSVARSTVQAGTTPWLLAVSARQPLIGSVAANAQWFVLAGGLLGALLIASVVETAARRRDAALALYATEHYAAETLQRSLLPKLYDMPGLELAARYLAGGQGQQVGGDWFDVFEVADGRVGIAVGDVMGHDIAAASAMAQIRSALRAFASDGIAPAAVLDRLARFIDTFDVTQLVTVLYGVLEPAAEDGSRMLTYANAGHLPPLLRHDDGRVDTLAGGGSVVIGAPIDLAHEQAQHRIDPGGTLLLFTDGLVEVPGLAIEDSLDKLAGTITGADVEADPDAICERVLTAMTGGALRDDIALLAVRVLGGERRAPAPREAATVGEPA